MTLSISPGHERILLSQIFDKCFVKHKYSLIEPDCPTPFQGHALIFLVNPKAKVRPMDNQSSIPQVELGACPSTLLENMIS